MEGVGRVSRGDLNIKRRINQKNIKREKKKERREKSGMVKKKEKRFFAKTKGKIIIPSLRPNFFPVIFARADDKSSFGLIRKLQGEQGVLFAHY